jgi:S-adenosylmethionine:tRNA ribosyltransferase-isomerase
MQSFINIQEYTYDLPDDRIAYHPLANRDESKLLVYRSGKIEHQVFKNLADVVPGNSLLVLNDTKVIPARLHFQKESGADIEIFLLNPVSPDTLLSGAMLAKKQCTWHCTVGNLKRWKEGQVLSKSIDGVTITALLSKRSEGMVEFSWPGDQTFSEIITAAGSTPLPPYIKRDTAKEDTVRYQTIYSNNEGAVAAPTAGLHFTEDVFEQLSKKGIKSEFLTLHVSAGTFQPVKAENALDHVMHHEQISVTRQTVKNLLDHVQKIIPVGTTSMRTLESLYWFGVKLTVDRKASFTIYQTDPYQLPDSIEATSALQAILDHMDLNRLTSITGSTSIFIYPGYRFRLCHGLITNFHQPGSTLILLVAAFIGPRWRNVYAEAISREYRFLSYGDSSLLLP